MGEEYGRELERVRRARADFEASQDEVERRKQEYFTSVRTLHEAGMPLREIATALGLSHQRVHQMVEEATGKKGAALRRKMARAAKQGGVAVLVVLLAVSGFFTLRPDLSPLSDRGVESAISQAPSPTQTSKEKARHRRFHEFELDGCARQILILEDRFGHGRGRVPEIVYKPDCGVMVLESHMRAMESRLNKKARALTIEIKRARA